MLTNPTSLIHFDKKKSEEKIPNVTYQVKKKRRKEYNLQIYQFLLGRKKIPWIFAFQRRQFIEDTSAKIPVTNSLAEYVYTRHAKPIRGIVDVSVFAEVDPWRKSIRDGSCPRCRSSRAFSLPVAHELLVLPRNGVCSPSRCNLRFRRL